MDVRVGLWRRHRRIDAFELWCWRRLLKVPWTAGRSNQSILKEINPGISLEGMMLKLKLQYFGYLMRRVDSLEKTLMREGLGAGGEGDDRGWDGWMASRTLWTWVWVNSGGWWWTRKPGVLRFMGSQRVGHNWVTELNWTEWSVRETKVLLLSRWNYMPIIQDTAIDYWREYILTSDLQGFSRYQVVTEYNLNGFLKELYQGSR